MKWNKKKELNLCGRYKKGLKSTQMRHTKFAQVNNQVELKQLTKLQRNNSVFSVFSLFDIPFQGISAFKQ